MLYTEAEIRETLCRLGFAQIIIDAAVEMAEKIREEHEHAGTHI